MSRSTRGQASGNNALRKVPALAGGGTTTPPTAPPQPLRFDGVGEHVPDLTFVTAAPVTDSFLTGAVNYHTNCGLRPSRITSIENMLTELQGETGRIGRLRIVTHAVPQNISLRFVEGAPQPATLKEHFREFAKSDIDGLLEVLSRSNRKRFFTWSVFTVTSHIRNTNAAVLTPFGLNASGTPPPDLELFMFFSADHWFVRNNFVRRNGGNLSAVDRNHLLTVFTTLMALGGAPIKNRLTTVTDAHLTALHNVIGGMTDQDFRMTNLSFDYAVGPDDIDPFVMSGRCAVAVQNGLRAKIEAIRKRFDKRSAVDIRGCRAGEDRDYLVAVQEFFGRPNELPEVSGPNWFQFFGASLFSHPQNNNEIRALFTGALANFNRTAFEDWAKRSRVDPGHKAFWTDLFNGNVVAFAAMQWRTAFPALPFTTPGLTAFAALAFRDALGRIGQFFNIPAASVPTGAVLNTLNTFVTGPLAGVAADLTRTVTAAQNATLPQLFDKLKDFNNAIGASVVPATAPSPLKADDITGYQSGLIDFLKTHQLAPVQTLMTAAKQRIDDAAQPGIFFYMLHIGLPVFTFPDIEPMIPGHIVNIQRSRLVVLHNGADDAYRQWPPLLWAEPLPPGNTIPTLLAANAESRRFAMMVEAADPGNSRVAACPHPGYMAEIRIVPGSP